MSQMAKGEAASAQMDDLEPRNRDVYSPREPLCSLLLFKLMASPSFADVAFSKI